MKVPVSPKGDDTGATLSVQGALLLVGTPIGNIGDFAPRALDALRAADLVAAEDPRRAGLLLAPLGIKTPLVAYHDYNEAAQAPALLARLQAGETIALISDAGLPLVADPGWRLVQAAIGAGLRVSAVPGPNAALLALILSGLPGERFYFHGFLPAKAGARRAALAALATLPATLVFYEAPHRIAETLADAQATLGPRAAAVARELTKTYEEVRRADLPALAAHYAAHQALGEIVLVIAGHDPASAVTAATTDDLLRAALRHMRVRDAARAVAAQTGEPASELYARALKLQDGDAQ